MKDHLQQDVAEFFFEFSRIALFEGVEKLVGFLEQAGLERSVSLLLIPGTTVVAAQARHHIQQFGEFSFGCFLTHAIDLHGLWLFRIPSSVLDLTWRIF